MGSGLIGRIRSEYAYGSGMLAALNRLTPIARRKDHTYLDLVEELALKHGDRPALLSERETLSFLDYDRRANRYARWALAMGLEKGEIVGLLMTNRPEYLVIWLGLARAGVVVALLNTTLTGTVLAQSLQVARPNLVIVAAELADNFDSAVPFLSAPPNVWRHGGADGPNRIDRLIMDYEDAPLRSEERRRITIEDRCLYIYTSGTTGLPKAANINHYRIQAIMNGFAALMRTSSSDRIYVTLPMYHSAGGVLAVGACLTVGGSVYIREHFSSGKFWDDVVTHECTIFQYVGELCRYLVNAPPHKLENSHRLRLACGNGLRPDIWREFQARFSISRILEFYAATESNAVLLNLDGKHGSVGRVPFWLRHRFLVALVRYDVESEEPVRGPDGRLFRCKADEVGELLAEIVDDPLKPSQRFEGYADAEATQRKILSAVFRPGDRWFRTGDLMRQDSRGYFYFLDRIGDTFRWKGENVATSQVAEILCAYPEVREANVYGVKVGGFEGRAGMAAIVAREGIDLAALREHVHERLPPPARPLFFRLSPHISVTGTFKHRKLDLVGEGFDPAQVAEPIYFDHPVTKRLELVDAPLFKAIAADTYRL